MELIKIVIFIMGSLFGVEEPLIFADKTTVTVYPKEKEVAIVQEGLFSVIESDKDKERLRQEWEELSKQDRKELKLSEELNAFHGKDFNVVKSEKYSQASLTLTYKKLSDLKILGINYNKRRNELSTFHVPQWNIESSEGEQEDCCWFFDANKTFSFTLEPYANMPDKYKKLKRSLHSLLL